MTARVDYRCRHCGREVELAVATPPATIPCAACGATAKRLWSGFGIGSMTGGGERSASTPSQSSTEPAAPSDGGELCRTNPGVPGLCLLGQSAGRAMVARATGDGRSLEQEQRRQTDFLTETGRHATVISDHGHSHGGQGLAGGNSKTLSPGPREIC